MTENLLAAAAAQSSSTDAATATTDAAQTQQTSTETDAGKTAATDASTTQETEAGKEDEAGKEGAKEGEAEKPAGPPEKYEAFTLPDGLQADDAQLTEFGDFARDLGLSQEAAQKLLDRYAGVLSEPAKAYQQVQETWIGEIKADKEIGGANLEKSLGLAAKALDQFGGKQLREALNVTGAGNHPAIVRAFVAIGKAISEDTFVGGGKTAPEKSLAQSLYPTMSKE